GLAVYAALLAGVEPHPGVLIVTRLKAQADEIAETINALAGRTGEALAYHTDVDVEPKVLQKYPTLIVTHKAYELGLDAINRGEEHTSNWKYLHAWSLTGRQLVVIDEALDIVEEAQIDLARVKVARAIIPFDVAARFPKQVEALAFVEDILTRIGQVAKER